MLSKTQIKNTKVKNMKRSILIIISAVMMAACSAPAQVAVIANKGVSVSSLDLAGLKNLYILDSKNIGGSKAQLFDVREGTALKTKFYDALGTTPDAIKKIWLKAKLTGAGEAPTPVSEEEMVQKVASTPGGIGFVSAAKVTGDVKVLIQIK
jgi:hypothetical protein